MNGLITNGDILTHPIVTIRSFGWRIFGKALFARQQETFLSLLEESDIFCQVKSKKITLLEQSIDLELQAKRIYEAFAKTFAASPAAREFFEVLSRHEQTHADILEFCLATANQNGCNDLDVDYLNLGQVYLPSLAQKMQAAETSAQTITALDDALRLMMQIESSEVNKIFHAILAGSDSAFVKKMEKFQKAMEYHMSYIRGKIAELSPELTQDSEELSEKFLVVA